ETPAVKADYGHFVDGDPVTRIVIPKFSVDMIVVEGTGSRSLNTGAGHYPDTPLPGQPGNIGIAGHRTMYGKPFNRIHEFTAGDKVYLITPFDKYTYEILPPFDGHANPWVVEANSWDVVSPTAESMLTMTACHPIGSARQRIVARAKLVATEPLVNATAR
ncbi:MAG TPA: class E sortase, partial [Actinomycetota bacterium]|nr:class E sortase [Actinomycetota bacterium]